MDSQQSYSVSYQIDIFVLNLALSKHFWGRTVTPIFDIFVYIYHKLIVES
jgi:hypothetical protein